MSESADPSDVKKGMYAILKERPCLVSSVSFVGKKKVTFVGYDIFNNQKIEESCKPTDKMQVPEIDRTDYTVADIEEDGSLTLMDDEGNSLDDLSMPEDDEYLKSEIQRKFDDEEEFEVTVLSACDIEKIVAIVEEQSEDEVAEEEDDDALAEAMAALALVHPKKWSAKQVGTWMKTIDEQYRQYADACDGADFDGCEMSFISDGDDLSMLEDIGFKSKGQMRKFKLVVEDLFDNAPEEEKPAPAAPAQVQATSTNPDGPTDWGPDAFLAALKASDPIVGNPIIGAHHATGPRGLQEALDAAEFHDAQVLGRLRRWDVSKKVEKALKAALIRPEEPESVQVDKSTITLLTNLIKADVKLEAPVYGLHDPAIPGKGALLEVFRAHLPDDDSTVQAVDRFLEGVKIDDSKILRLATMEEGGGDGATATSVAASAPTPPA